MAFYEGREVVAPIVQIPRVQAFADWPGWALFASMESAHSVRPEAWSSKIEWVWLSP